MSDRSVIASLRSQIESIESGSSSNVKSGKNPGFKKGKKPKEKDFSSPQDAFSKIIALVNASDKSEVTIRERLLKAGFSEPAIEEAVQRAKTYGFIDDMRYADVLIRSRMSQGKGVMGIERELRSQNIDIGDVPGWPAEFGASADSEFDRALAFIEAHPPRSKNLRESAFRKLVAKGYSSSTASSVARTWHSRLLEGESSNS